MKSKNEDKSKQYVYLLKRLAYVSFLNRKYTESERYFKITCNMMPTVSQNPSLIFEAHKNLLLLYMHMDLDKARDQAKRMEVDEYLP